MSGRNLSGLEAKDSLNPLPSLPNKLARYKKEECSSSTVRRGMNIIPSILIFPYVSFVISTFRTKGSLGTPSFFSRELEYEMRDKRKVSIHGSYDS